jgi:hypothetical protein
LVCYGKQGLLEYDFVLAPGADPYAITLGIEGLAAPVRLNEHGHLVLSTVAGSVLQLRPVVYQEEAGVRRTIAGEYVLKGG